MRDRCLVVFRVGGGIFWMFIVECDGTTYIGGVVIVCVVIRNLGMVTADVLDVIIFVAISRT